MSNKSELTVDVLIVGSGAGGMAAAATARKLGLDVLVVEKSDKFGGTTAYSGGVLWIPGSHHSFAMQRELGVEDSVARARSYLVEECGSHAELERIDAYLEAGPKMVEFLEANTHVKFYGMDYPDYRSESAHSSNVRSIGTVDFTARELGTRLGELRNVLPQTLFMGLAVGSGVEMIQFMRAGRSVKAMGFVVRKMIGHCLQVLRYGEGQQVVRGRALIARLARSILDGGGKIWTSAPVRSLTFDGDRVSGAEVTTQAGVVSVRARRGVVLACGGFPNDPERRAAVFPAVVAVADHRTPANGANTGDGIRLGEAAGGVFNEDVSNAAAWMPISVMPGRDGENGVWPHLVDRQKPGFICVLANGQRFVDEASSYHDMVPHLVAACEREGYPEATCWLIGDKNAVKRWGIGAIRPFPVPHGEHIRSGYALQAKSLRELASKANIDADQLELTVTRFNENARAGRDPDFNRGGRVYDLYQGEAGYEPNPCLGPLEQEPFYAVRIRASEIGTYAGLRTDASSRVLDRDGQPIEGLYAVGNDQTSVFAGAYPGAGATLGPAVTFGYIAGRHLAEAGKPERNVSEGQ